MINIYSIEEAERKTCPVEVREHCITSECMVWCWQEDVRDAETLEELRTHGYCGLINKRKD